MVAKGSEPRVSRLGCQDSFTPFERAAAWREGRPVDRVMCMPFIGGVKNTLAGVSYEQLNHDAQAIVHAESLCYERYGYDRIVIGPNTVGISEALGLAYEYPQFGPAFAREPLLGECEQIESLKPVDAASCDALSAYWEAAGILARRYGTEIRLECSVGGPFTIASQLRGVEALLRDCRKNPEAVDALLDVVVQSQKGCMDKAASLGFGIAMADPVANPQLIGPRYYKRFVYPRMLELTEYARAKTGMRVSLHMCGHTRCIWDCFKDYQLHELSLDNLVDLAEAAQVLGPFVPLAGNVDPVEVMLKGTREEVFESVERCIAAGLQSACGFTLATGCDIPDSTNPEKVDWFMEAARRYCSGGVAG